jgi:glycine reductase
MNGPGAEYSPFSSMPLIVLQIEATEGITPHQHEELVRLAGLRTAEYLCQTTREVLADEVEAVADELSPANAALPRVAYVYMVLSQGLLHDTYVLGRDAKQGLPRVIGLAALLEGSIVSGNCVSACDKNTTYHHQNNSVLRQLLDGHGVRWNFAGAVVTNEPVRLADKQESARRAIVLVNELRADGAVISKEGFGNPDADLMLIVRGLEQAGVKTVAITDEYAGVDGGSQSLADATPEADAIISVGNANAAIVLPAMHRTIGPLPDVTRLAGGYPHSLRADGSIEVELQAIIGATNQLGFGPLSCREM